MNQRLRHLTELLCFTVCSAVILSSRPELRAADSYTPFDGEKTSWHEGFDRYDFVMDETSAKIEPFKVPRDEVFGVKDPNAGQRRCIVVVPRQPAAGNPWSWRGCYWDHQPQTEVELLRRGFHIAYISANARLKPGKEWDAWYEFLTDKHGLSKKPAFIGMSRGGEYAYTWATGHPDKVACIYADNPGMNREALGRLGDLARNDVPLLHVCGSIDPLLGKNSMTIERIYQQLGGRISVMIKEGAGHHPHSLRDPKPIADFIEQSVNEKPRTAPAYLAGRTTHDFFYGAESVYCQVPKEGTFITYRGSQFVECYNRYTFELPGVEGSITVIEPTKPAQGMPWVFRADFVPRESTVDLALLAKGFHIVTGPVPYNADGPNRAHWDAVYNHLIAHGFSANPAMAGAGGAAGDAYVWAIQNPGKVSCIYAENPLLRSTMSKTPILDNLEPLAKAGIPLLHVCGSEDPSLAGDTRPLEARYKSLGGKITVMIDEGEGHFPTCPKDPKSVVEFVMQALH